MGDRSYPHITRLVMEQPWAILPGTLAAIRELVVMRANGERFTDEEIQERIGAGPARRSASRSTTGGANDVAVIPIYGSIVPKANIMTEISGGTSVADLRGAFMQAMADPDIGAVVFDVDSPGGLTDQMPEFAADIRSQRGKKPVLAVSNTMMASAAYWIASQADEVAVSPSSLTGSIGVFAAHDDLSAASEQVGVKTTLISAGKYKTEGNPYEALSDDARGHIQDLVDSAYGMFTADVAKGRRVAVDSVRSGYGEGRVLDAKSAVKVGLADRVATLPQTISRAAGLAAQKNGTLAASMDQIRRAVGLPDDLTLVSDSTPLLTDLEAGARGDASFADHLEAVLCMASDLVAKGRPLTAAKRDRLHVLGERIADLVAVKEPRDPSFDLEAEVAAMRARARIAATKLRRV
jgi:signal peptide peptidase SppA